jgi:putative ABC transport system permease protein
MMLNESAVAALGFTDPEAAVGLRFTQGTSRGIVVGVVEDFHYESFHHLVGPLSLQVAPRNLGYFTLRLATDDLRATIADLEALWRTLAPDRPFLYRFLDAMVDAQYRAETRFGALVGLFAALAVLIACLGLFGLASFTAARRRKEIGVRKALGASVWSIVVLLSSDVLKLVGLAFAVGAPLAYVGMQRWLDTFAYRADVGPGLIALAGALAGALALLTVGVQAVRAARADPSKALRQE